MTILYMSLSRFRPSLESASLELALATHQYEEARNRPYDRASAEYFRFARERLEEARSILHTCRNEVRYGE